MTEICTIGHSTGTLDALVERLSEHEVELLVDVRSKPRSRLPHFDQVPMQSAVEDAGMRYRFLGDRLGGVPQDPRVRDRWQQGRLDDVIVAHLRSTDEWHDGLAELVRLAQAGGGTKLCLLCSEADPNECHRKAVALDLAELLRESRIVHLALNRTAPLEVGVQEVML